MLSCLGSLVTISFSSYFAMVVKKVMPKGGRKSSPTLWSMVRGLSDDEWRQMKAFSMVYGKGSLQFRLLGLLRSMEVYDSGAEKAAFEGHALNSMRNTARKWLLRTACRLAFYKTEVCERVLDVEVLLRWGYHEFTLEHIEEAKQLATEQEEYTWLDMLLHQEITVTKLLYEGEDRSHRIQAISAKAVGNARMLVLKAEIEGMVAKYLEHGRNKLLMSGNYDSEIAQEYFKSNFYRQSIGHWPISFQIQKLRIDEALHYFSGNVADAAKVAEQILAHTQALERIRAGQTEEQSRIMFRLSAYYTDLGEKAKLMGIIARFRELLATSSPFRMNYLRRMIVALFHAAFDYDLQELAVEGHHLWNENQEFLRAMPHDIIGMRAIHLACASHLAMGRIGDARKLFAQASTFSDSVPNATMQCIHRFFHLMILLDEEDDRGLESFAKNYKRYIKQLLPSRIGSAALAILVILGKTSNLEGQAKMRNSMKSLIGSLSSLQNSKETNFKPYIFPMIKWAERHLKR